MPHVTLAQPLSRLLQPSVVLDYGGLVGTQGVGNGIQLQCWLDQIGADVSEGGDLQTFCNPFERTHSLSIKMTAELYALLKPLENKQVTYATLRDSSQAVSATNPEFSFIVEVPSIPIPVSGGVRSIDAVTLEFVQIGGTVTANTAGTAVTTHPV